MMEEVNEADILTVSFHFIQVKRGQSPTRLVLLPYREKRMKTTFGLFQVFFFLRRLKQHIWALSIIAYRFFFCLYMFKNILIDIFHYFFRAKTCQPVLLYAVVVAGEGGFR
jgi:hypothetical protein